MSFVAVLLLGLPGVRLRIDPAVGTRPGTMASLFDRISNIAGCSLNSDYDSYYNWLLQLLDYSALAS